MSKEEYSAAEVRHTMCVLASNAFRLGMTDLGFVYSEAARRGLSFCGPYLGLNHQNCRCTLIPLDRHA
jgi:hypothetical protein